MRPRNISFPGSLNKPFDGQDILSLRPQWKGVLQHHDLKREKTKTFNMSPHHKLHRMKDAETDEGCLQAFVRPPSSKIQILWSLIGSLLIVWDLITIPLELFDVDSLINFLVNVGRFSFAFWVLDVRLGFSKSCYTARLFFVVIVMIVM